MKNKDFHKKIVVFIVLSISVLLCINIVKFEEFNKRKKESTQIFKKYENDFNEISQLIYQDYNDMGVESCEYYIFYDREKDSYGIKKYVGGSFCYLHFSEEQMKGIRSIDLHTSELVRGEKLSNIYIDSNQLVFYNEAVGREQIVFCRNKKYQEAYGIYEKDLYSFIKYRLKTYKIHIKEGWYIYQWKYTGIS